MCTCGIYQRYETSVRGAHKTERCSHKERSNVSLVYYLHRPHATLPPVGKMKHCEHFVEDKYL